MKYTRTSDSASEPVDSDTVKAELRITDTRFDAVLPRLIKQARRRAEFLTGRALLTQTWVGRMDGFPCEICVPVVPIIAVSSITYYDTSNALQTLSSSAYDTDLTGLEGRIVPAAGYTWPGTYPRLNAVALTWTAGYANAAAIPEPIIGWMIMTIDAYLENYHGAVGTSGGGPEIQPNPFLDRLLDEYCVVRV